MIEITQTLERYKKIWYLVLICLSFYAFVAINLLLYSLCHLAVAKSLPPSQIVYGYSNICGTSSFSYNLLMGTAIFLILKTALTIIPTKAAPLKNQFVTSFLITTTLMDLVYVALQAVPVRVRIKWDYYFQSSFLINKGQRLGFPDWVVFLVVGVICSFILKNNLKLSWNDLGKYFLIAFASFGFQALVFYCIMVISKNG